MPGLIWLYYDYDTTICNSPVDDHIPLMVIFYFVISIILFVVAINTCLDRCYIINAGIVSLYILSKLGLGITMLVFIQRDYYGDWENTICPNLKPLTLFWLIWNYIIICISFILGCIYFIFSLCDC